jgi:hypothetical protein
MEIIRNDSVHCKTMQYDITVENIPRQLKQDRQHGG